MDRDNTRPFITDRPPKKSLGEMLVEENLITPEQLESALALQRQQGGKLSEILTNQGVVKAEVLATVLSIQLNLPLIDLKRHTIQPQALRLIPEEMARKHALIPLDIVNDSLIVVMADPEDIHTIEDVKTQAKMRVEVALGVRSDIERAIDLNYRSSGEIEKQVSQMAPASGEKIDVKEIMKVAASDEEYSTMMNSMDGMVYLIHLGIVGEEISEAYIINNLTEVNIVIIMEALLSNIDSAKVAIKEIKEEKKTKDNPQK